MEASTHTPSDSIRLNSIDQLDIDLGIKIEGPDGTATDIDGEDDDNEFLCIADLLSSSSQSNQPDAATVTAIAATFKKLLRRVQELEVQVASCLETQPLVYQALGKCGVSEDRVKAIKEDVDERFPKVTTTSATPGSGDQHQETQERHNGAHTSHHHHRRHQLRTIPPKPKRPEATSKRQIAVVQLAAPELPQQRPKSNQNVVQQNEDQNEVHQPNDNEQEHAASSGESDNDFDRPSDSTDTEYEEGRVEPGPGDVNRNSYPHQYQCKVCPMASSNSFSNPEELAGHYTSQHSVGISCSEEVMMAEIKLENMNAGEITDEGSAETEDHCEGLLQTHECVFCAYKFSTKKSMQDHKRRVHQDKTQRVECKVCGRSLQEHSLKAHMEIHRRGGDKRQRVYCETCGVGFFHQWDLRVHTRIHTGENMFPCSHPKCGKQFNRRSVLATHLLTHKPRHERKRPFVCTYCGKGFQKRSAMEEHEAIHTGKPFVCDECGWACTRATYLRNHKRCHGGGED